MDKEPCEGIPFNPEGSMNRIQVIGPSDFTFPTTDSHRLFKANPRRLWLLVTWEGPSTITRLSTKKTSSTAGIGETGGSGYILIHNASLPGLVQGEWFAHENAGRVLTLYEGQRYE